jgi:crotonobetainyl-CoA:carnitine CoA-transferase CaiB-like acyl-CoA transferase
MGIEELEENPKFENSTSRRQNASELISRLDEVFATKTREEWLAIFEQRAKFAYSPVNTIEEVASDPQVLENEYFVPFDHPTLGSIEVLASPVKFSETPFTIRSAAPELGQHTEEVLLEIGGYSWQDIAKLKEQGAI